MLSTQVVVPSLLEHDAQTQVHLAAPGNDGERRRTFWNTSMALGHVSKVGEINENQMSCRLAQQKSAFDNALQQNINQSTCCIVEICEAIHSYTTQLHLRSYIQLLRTCCIVEITCCIVEIQLCMYILYNGKLYSSHCTCRIVQWKFSYTTCTHLQPNTHTLTFTLSLSLTPSPFHTHTHTHTTYTQELHALA